MQSVICSLQSVVCSLQSAVCSLQMSDTDNPYRLFTVPYFSQNNRETVTASFLLVLKECGQILVPPLIKSINNFLSWRKKNCQIREI